MTAKARALGVALALTWGGCDDPCERLVLAGDDAHLDVCVARAESADDRRRGLIGRALAEDAGLLLVFPVEGEVCITNEGVAFPIDVAWLDAAGTVTALERALPADAPGPWCHAPAAFVLEVHAGVADAVVVGDQRVE